MPVDQHGDQYNNNEYGGDRSLNGRIHTKKQSKEEKGQDWMEDVFVETVLPIYFPEIKSFSESFNSMEMDPGEYTMDSDTNESGEVIVFCDVACTPVDFSRLSQLSYEELIAPFHKAAVSLDRFDTEILTNEDNPEVPTMTFQITIY